MTKLRKIALWAGVLYLLTFAFSIPTLGLKSTVEDDVDFILGTGSDTAVMWAGVFDVITALTGIGTAVALYPVARRVSRSAATGFVASRTLEASMLFVSFLSLMSIVTLREDMAGSADADTLVIAGQSLVAFHDWSFVLGPGVMPAINALFLGTVMYRSGLVPRILPLIGLIGAPILIASALATTFGAQEQTDGTAALLALPIAAWELGLGVYLTVKGFRPSPYIDDEDPTLAGRQLAPA